MLNVRKCLAVATLTLCCLPWGLGLAAPKRIGLLPVKNFSGYTGNVDFGSIIEGEVASRLLHNSNYTLVERSHVREVLNELGYDLNTGYTDDISKQVANTAGLDYIITAEVTQATVAQQYIPLVGEQLKAKVGVRLIAIDKNDGRRIFDQTVEDTASKQDLSDLSAIAAIGALGGFGSHDDDRDYHHDNGWHRDGQGWYDSHGIYHQLPPGYNRGPQVPPGYRPAPNGGWQRYPAQPAGPGDPNSSRSRQRPGDPNAYRNNRPGDPGPSQRPYWQRSNNRPQPNGNWERNNNRPAPSGNWERNNDRQAPNGNWQHSNNRPQPNGQRNTNKPQPNGNGQPDPRYRPTSFASPVTAVQATFVVPLPAASYEPRMVELPQVSAARVRYVSTDSYLEKYGASLVADATRGAARKAMNQFEEFNPIVGTVIGRGEDELYIDLGRKDGIQEGEKLNVYREGTPVRNTQGDIVLVPQKKIGKLKVTTVSEAASVCENNGDVRVGDKVRRGDRK